MSGPGYPPAVYSGNTGERSAVLRRAGAPPELSAPSGNATSYLATGEPTRGAFGLYQWDMGAQPSGPSPHFHRSITESFFVLNGTVRLYEGARWLDAVAGDFLFVAEGGVHGFRNESGEPASMLLLFTPGAPREDYVETVADAARREAMTPEAMTPEVWTEFFLRHDTFWMDGS